MENFTQATHLEAVTCPACGLLCDDLSLERGTQGTLKVSANGCAKSVQFFERPVGSSQAKVAGKASDLNSAISTAAKLIKQATHPLIAGLATDIQGMRSVMNLAESSSASIDHMNSKSSMRNILVVQNSGWQITTLTEVKNRVDLLVLVGTDLVNYFPRFFERNVWNAESMFGQDTASRQVVYLGGTNLNTAPGTSPNGKAPTVLPCDKKHIPEVLAVLRALVAGKKLVATEVAGIAVADLQALAEHLKAAQYSVIAWTASAFDYEHAELSIQNITGIIEKLNLTTRSSGLPMSGNEGDVGAYNTSTWISGYPFRSSYRHQQPDYEPYFYNSERMLKEGETDVLLWLNSYKPEQGLPAGAKYNIVIGHADTQFSTEPDVFIPVATPGIETHGTQFRSDSSVALPLRKLRDSTLPTLTQVLAAIEAAL
jgi:formylmethanofuran dehydrogenase subunit B